MIGGVLMTGALLIILFKLFKPFFLNTLVWFIGSLLIYSICMAGVVYNIIHNIPFVTTDRNGNTEWFTN